MCAGFVVCGPLGPRGDLWARSAVVRVLYCVLVTACRAVRPYRGRARREKVETLLLGTKPGNRAPTRTAAARHQTHTHAVTRVVPPRQANGPTVR